MIYARKIERERMGKKEKKTQHIKHGFNAHTQASNKKKLTLYRLWNRIVGITKQKRRTTLYIVNEHDGTQWMTERKTPCPCRYDSNLLLCSVFFSLLLYYCVCVCVFVVLSFLADCGALSVMPYLVAFL